MSEQAKKKRHSRIELDFLPQKYANRSVERRRGIEREGITKKQNCFLHLVSNSDVKKYVEGI